MKRFVVILVVGLFLSVPGFGAEPEKKKADKKKEAPRVITTEDLKKEYGDPEKPVIPPPPPLPPQPQPASESDQAAAADAVGKAAEAKLLKALKAEKSHLEGRIRSLRNPFLPRAKPTQEEQKAEEGKGSAERVQMLEKRLKKVDADLKKLETPAKNTKKK
jgi:hypothetical protein